jgi:hypothetical protein
MVEYLKKFILDNWDEWFDTAKPVNLDFLKTHAGQAIRNKKVGFFVFNHNKPIIFAKTVRDKKLNSIITDGFDKLKAINGCLKDNSVPEAICCDHYQDTAFSLEGAINGKQFHSFKRPEDLKKFLEWFFRFQQSMKNGKEMNGDRLQEYLASLVNDFIRAYCLEDDLVSLINNIVGDLRQEINSLKLPLVVQHGDLTPDNALIDNNQVKVIDWDNFGKINLPLFDLLVFLQRWSAIRNIDFLVKYNSVIQKYFDEFSIDKKALKFLVFCYYLLDFLRKKEALTNHDKEYLKERLKEINALNL